MVSILGMVVREAKPSVGRSPRRTQIVGKWRFTETLYKKKTTIRQACSQKEYIADDGPGTYDSAVSLAEIKQLATQLPPEELTALTAFLVKRDQSAWDDQMERDAASGKLDRLFEEAESERANGTLRDWPD